MHLLLRHHTEYIYPYPARDSHNEVRLRPLDDATQHCRSFRMTVYPNVSVHSYREVGGMVHHFSARAPHDRLSILVEAEVDTYLHNPFDNLDTEGRNWEFYRSAADAHIEFLGTSPYVGDHPEATELACAVRQRSDGTVAKFLLDLNQTIHRRMEYDPDVTHVHSTLEDVLHLRAGVCQDFAHLMLACLRSQGIPSRYVSGYLYVGNLTGMRGEQATHAWVESLLPDGRWLALDPTNNLLANDHYIKVHYGRDYSEVSPTRGVYVGVPASTLNVSVNVEQATVGTGVQFAS